MSIHRAIQVRVISGAVAFAGLCLAVSPAALALDAPPASTSAPPAGTAVPPAPARPAPAPAAAAAAPPAPAPPPGYAYPPPGSGPPPAYSPEADMIPSGYHTHDGAYGRFALGFGGVSGSASGQKYSGTSFAVAVAGGTAITESLILYLEFLAHGIPHPRFEGNGGWTATAARASGLGPGVAYYFMPLNLYLSGTFLYQLLDFGGVQWDLSHPLSLGASGVGCSLMVGKEWWVSANWGLGAAAQLLLGESTGASADGRWTAKALAIMFSSTYN